MVALLAEKRISLTQLAKREGVNTSTVWRWVNRGVRGVKLAAFCVGGRSFATDSLWEQFVRATTAAADRDESIVTSQPSRAAANAHDAEEAFLAAEGI